MKRKFRRLRRQVIDDISHASAALVWNTLPEIGKLPCVEGFERLADHFRAAFMAYFDSRQGWLLEPSDN